MALQIDLTTSNFGVPFNGAYFRVVTACINRSRDKDLRHTVMIDVVGYATKPIDEDTKEVDFRRYQTPLTDIELQIGDSFLEKTYKWVSLQEDMIGSVAV